MVMTHNHSKTVAIVDDDLAVLAALKFLLEIAGHAVATYSSAAAFLKDRTAQPACLILNQHMPHMTGLELAAQLRSKGVDIPVLLVTEQPSPVVSARAAQLGIKRVVGRPLNPDDLLSFINAYGGTSGSTGSIL